MVRGYNAKVSTTGSDFALSMNSGGTTMTILLRLAVAMALLVTVSDPSEARYHCAAIRTPDGFVALRQGPSAQHPIVGKMKPQESVLLLHPPDYNDIVRKGDWLFVSWIPGTRRTSSHMPKIDESKSRTGWVRDKLIDCFEE
jgi:hypothetical protein